MNENWKFSDIPYHRPDVEALQARYDALTRRAREARSPEELVEIVRQRDALQQEVGLCQAVAFIRAFHDVTDEFYQTELQETLPRLEGSLDSQSLAAAIAESPYAPALDQAFGPQLRRLLTLDHQIHAGGRDLQARISQLTALYQQLTASARYPVQGELLSGGQLRAALASRDRARRKAAYDAQQQTVLENAGQLEDILRQLVHARIELAPGVVMNFVRIPAGKFVMGSNKGHSDYSPANKQEVKKAFWMAEIEVSNEQFRTIFPDHNSRFVNQLWKDHVHQGYPANNPEQPAIRVSWEEAMAFCEKLSEKTGLKVTLPTEVQWEWACRAGSEDDFWYGALNTDFAAYENMGDKQLNKLAVRGVNPQPMNPGDPWYKYYTYQPKDNNVDDGNMLMVKGGGYQANPWGLYDMQGNIAEWTRSDYLPYPYNEKAQGNGTEKVVRGGSWTDHPKTSTAYYRKSYLPWQKVHNVGFRVIIED